MIRSFKDRDAERIFQGQACRPYGSMYGQIAKKLTLLHAAVLLDDLRNPPGNRLERLRGDRAGQHSLRINQQFRLCFVWKEGDAYDVEVTDSH